MSPKCDRSVTGPPITVFCAGTLRWHPRCTGHVDLRCTASVHRRSIQGVPRCKLDGFFVSVSFRFIQDVLGRFTLGTPVGFIQDVPKVSPPGTSWGHHNPKPTLDVVFGLVLGSLSCLGWYGYPHHPRCPCGGRRTLFSGPGGCWRISSLGSGRASSLYSKKTQKYNVDREMNRTKPARCDLETGVFRVRRESRGTITEGTSGCRDGMGERRLITKPKRKGECRIQVATGKTHGQASAFQMRGCFAISVCRIKILHTLGARAGVPSRYTASTSQGNG